MSPVLPETLPEDYYLDNFHYFLDFVSSNYIHLLSAEEQDFSERFRSLNIGARRLYVRLTNRKGSYFRCDKIKYEGIPDLAGALNDLLQLGLAQPSVPDFDDAVRLCCKPELMALAEFKDWPRSAKKADLIARLTELESINPIEELQIAVIELLGLHEFTIFRLLFFGNFHQDMTEFVLHELVAPFERYDLSTEAMSFSTRDAVAMVLRLKELSDEAYEVIEADSNGDAIVDLAGELPVRPGEPIAARRYDRIVNRLARQLERRDRNQEALVLYELSVATPSRERRARLLEKLNRFQESIGLCEEIECEPLDQEEREFARLFGPRVSRKSGLNHGLPVLQKYDIPTETIEVSHDLERVEECAVRYYEQKGARCFYVENALFNGLFGLVFWDIIFSSVPGAFFNPFQRGPADLHTGDFIKNRRSKIERRLAEIADADELSRLVFNVFNQKAGIANDFVYWGFWSEELLHLSVERISPQQCQAVFSRMLTDLKNNTSGFPDLIMFYDDDYKLVEIKGPGDKLQKNQERWFQYFMDQCIPASLVNVEWSMD